MLQKGLLGSVVVWSYSAIASRPKVEARGPATAEVQNGGVRQVPPVHRSCHTALEGDTRMTGWEAKRLGALAVAEEDEFRPPSAAPILICAVRRAVFVRALERDRRSMLWSRENDMREYKKKCRWEFE